VSQISGFLIAIKFQFWFSGQYAKTEKLMTYYS